MGLGSPAITPHLNAHIPLLPTFTREDVIAWVSVNPIGRMIALEPPTIGKIVFSSAWRMNRLLHTSTGLFWLAPVCHVELLGRFDAPHPYGATQRTFIRIWAVLDGRTGNFLMAGGTVK